MWFHGAARKNLSVGEFEDLMIQCSQNLGVVVDTNVFMVHDYANGCQN